MRFNYLISVSLLLLITVLPLRAEEKGDIKKYEAQLQDTTGQRSGNRHSDREHQIYSSDSDDDGLASVIFELGFRGCYAVFVHTEGEIGNWYNGIWPGFNEYPYCPRLLGDTTYAEMKRNGYSGGQLYKSGLYNNSLAGLKGRHWRFTEMTSVFRHSSDLDGYQVTVRGSFATLFELSVESSELREEVNGVTDRLQLTNIFLEYNRFRYSQFVFRWGLGWKGVSGDQSDGSAGVSMGAELYPVAPVSLYYHYSGAFINSAYVSEHQFRVNVHFNRYFGHVGYQVFRAGEEGIPGLLVGVGAGF